MIFDLINSALRLLITALLVYKILRCYTDLKWLERIGIGLISSGSFLTIPPIWAIRPGYGVFDGWAVSVMSIGILLHFSGRMWRLIDHDRRNRQMRLSRR